MYHIYFEDVTLCQRPADLTSPWHYCYITRRNVE